MYRLQIGGVQETNWFSPLKFVNVSDQERQRNKKGTNISKQERPLWSGSGSV